MSKKLLTLLVLALVLACIIAIGAAILGPAILMPVRTVIRDGDSITPVVTAVPPQPVSSVPSAIATSVPETQPVLTTAPLAIDVTLVPADADAPAAGICAEAEGEWATVQIAPDMPSTRCLKVTSEQRLKVINGTDASVQIRLGPFTLELQPGTQGSLEAPFGDYLAPGVHHLMVSPYAGPELWLVEK